ncbi:UNVERIFIED_CONTAM: hypothetical protein FKN15_013321 [Acipenser sinensis]
MSEWGLAPLKKREPTELELLIQKTDWAALKWEWPAAQPEPSATEPRGEEPRGEEPPLPEPRGEAKSIPPPQPRPPPLRSSPASLRQVPRPLLLDTLPVFLDLPVLDLVPKSLQHWPQLCPWFPAPLSPSTQTSLGCCQTSLLLPLLAASLPLGDRTSLRRSPGEDLCPLLHPPVPRPTLRSPLSNRWGPSSPVRGPYLAGPGRGPIHPQVRPWKRAKIDICGLEGREKMNSLTLKLFDVDRVEHMFLDMCITTGTNAATAETIFEKMDSVLKKDNIPWQNCVGLSVDNANVNMGVCNSIKSRILSINPTVYVHGCPCHIVHNNASAAGTHYIELSDFDVEDMVVDIGYWFKASTKRKCRLDEFCVFCDTEYMAVIDHVSTRWLSLETAVIHILRLYRALVSYFKSNKFCMFCDTEHMAVIDHVSTRWLSLETAVIRILRLYRALVSYFKSNTEKQARFKRLSKYFEDPMTEVHRLLYQATLPVFTEINLLFQCQEPSVYLLHGQDELSDEFLDYQLMEEKGIPRSIWEQVVSRVNEQEVYHRMDKVWAHMATIKSPVTGMPKLPRLSKVAQLILTLPHSNADAERVFSMIGLNKTDTRNALALEGTLSSIMTIKMSGMEPNCFKYEPPAEVIKASKSAASSYNREHAAASNAGSECT